MECAVCMIYYEDDIYSTYCGHLFCKQCANGMIQRKSQCYTCNCPIQANSVHKIYLPPRDERQQSIDLYQENQGITKEEIIKTMLADLEIECEKNVKKCAKIKHDVDVYAMNYANFVSLNDELKRKNEVLEEKLSVIQQKLDRCEQIVNDFDRHGYNTRYKRRTAKSDRKTY
ncbi:uncharacterized protein [Chironomus tepperi]|uniref:uncharacterized protein n=1 Tax=Chironomus tepperi TaxID=113505 RepID=UPI00391F3696